MFGMSQATFVSNSPNSLVPGLPMGYEPPSHPTLAPAELHFGWDQVMPEQLAYLQSVDLLAKENDPDWIPEHVLNHRIRRRKSKRITMVQMVWKSGRKSWERIDPVRVEHPVLLMEYAARTNIPVVPSNRD